MPSDRSPLRATVAAWVGSANLGDELVFSALTNQLQARGVAVEVLSTAPKATSATHGVVAQPRRSAWTGSSDLMVLGGGGLLQDETSTLNLDLHLSPVVAARLRRGPVAGVGLGAGPLGTRSGRARVRAILGAMPLAVRDAESADLLERIGLRRPLVSADLALSLPVPTVGPKDRIVVCLRPWSGHRHRLPARFRQHRPDDRFAAGAAASLDALSESTGLAVHLVAFDAPKDTPLHAMVADRMRHAPTAAAPGVNQVVEEVAASQVVVSMRYHGGIAALLGGRPSILVGYSSKVGSLADEIGAGAVARRWTAEGLGDLVDAAERVMSRGDEVVEARSTLVERENGNGRVLDDLIERAERRRSRRKDLGGR